MEPQNHWLVEEHRFCFMFLFQDFIVGLFQGVIFTWSTINVLPLSTQAAVASAVLSQGLRYVDKTGNCISKGSRLIVVCVLLQLHVANGFEHRNVDSS